LAGLKAFATLMGTIDEIAHDLKLEKLSDSDQKIYAAIVLLSDANPRGTVNIRDLVEHSLTKNITTPTLYRSLKSLIQMNKIERIGSVKSGSYALKSL
jgi:predicted transcriptional regulator